MKVFVYELYSRKQCLWFIAKSFKLNRSLFTTSDLNDFYDPWVDKTKINCMSNVITDGSTSVIMPPITFEKGCIIII